MKGIWRINIAQDVQRILAGRTSVNPMNRAELLYELRARGHDELNDRVMRNEVARAVIDGHAPIGTTTMGYFLVTCRADMLAADGELMAKAQAISVRRNALWRNFQEHVEKAEQLEMPGLTG